MTPQELQKKYLELRKNGSLKTALDLALFNVVAQLVSDIVKGDKGDSGRDGKDGAPGRNGRDGISGRDGRDGKTPSQSEILKLIYANLPEVDTEAVAREAADIVGSRTPTAESIVNELPQFGERVRDSLELLEGDDRLGVESIKGLEDLDTRIEEAKSVRVVGGQKAVFLYIDGVKKGLVNTFDLKAGTGVSIAHSKVNGLDTLTFNASGPSVTVETPPETPNAVITDFTVSSQPQYVVADGATYFEGAGYSYSSLTVTMEIPPSSTIRVII